METCQRSNVLTCQRVNVHKEGKEEMEKGKYGQIKHFTDIEAWKLGRETVSYTHLTLPTKA